MKHLIAKYLGSYQYQIIIFLQAFDWSNLYILSIWEEKNQKHLEGKTNLKYCIQK